MQCHSKSFFLRFKYLTFLPVSQYSPHLILLPPIPNFKQTPFIRANIYTFPTLACFHTKIVLFVRMLQKAEETNYININCVDPLGRSALLMAIDNENLEMVELLINHRVDTKDALLHAISEEFVEAVEVLLDHEDCSHRDGDPHVSSKSVLKFCRDGWTLRQLENPVGFEKTCKIGNKNMFKNVNQLKCFEFLYLGTFQQIDLLYLINYFYIELGSITTRHSNLYTRYLEHLWWPD